MSQHVFECQTCHETTNDGQTMMKHLSSTRHKTLTADSQPIACEECENDNIHLLQIVRFRGEDISLLCNSCFSKEDDKPGTSYSLSNGTILNFWDQYVTVRDLQCDNCDSDSRLNAKRTGNNVSVLCDKCVGSGYTSERDDTFVYVVLGIKEKSAVKKPVNKRTRKVGRKGRRERKPRELTTGQQIQKKQYETKKANSVIESDVSVSLKSFKGVAADPKSSRRLEKVSGRDQVVKGGTRDIKARGRENGSKTFSARDGKVTKEETKSKEKKSEHKEKKSDSREKKSEHKEKKSDSREKKSEPKEKKSEPKEKKSEPKEKKAEPKEKKSVPKEKTAAPKEKKAEPKEKKSEPKEKKSEPKEKKSEPKEKKSKPKEKKAEPKEKKAEPTGKKSREDKNNSKKRESKVIDSKADSKTSSKKLDSKANGKSQINGKKPKEETRNSTPVPEDLDEGQVVHRSDFVPTLKFPDMNNYFNFLSNAIYLEQKLEAQFLEEFSITWPRDATPVFKISFPMSSLEHLMPLEMQRLGRMPFTKQSPIFLVSGNKVWYAYVKELQQVRKNLEVLLELYKWNSLSLPIGQSSSQFKVLPGSAQAARILFAMTRITNEKFIKMLLGHEPIKQLNFDNKLQFTKATLNNSQKSAIQHVLNNHITVLQGPPGSGKTSTIEEIIMQLMLNFNSWPILVVAASNIAIDNLAEKFIERNFRILRITSQAKEAEYGDSHPLGKICLHNRVKHALPDSCKDTIRYMRMGRFKEVSKNAYNKLLTAQNDLADHFIAQSQIIFTTNIAAGGRQLKAVENLPVVIMDESTQSTEASTLVPLSMPGVKRFVFVGDDKQLSSFSNVPELELSLFERVLLNGTYRKPHMLDTQYRMHPVISEFPRTKFYNGLLKDGITAEQRISPAIKHPLYLMKCGVKENKVRVRGRFTYNNMGQCEEVVKVLHLLLGRGVTPEQIGVITPYSSQRDLISSILVDDSTLNPTHQDMVTEIDRDDFDTEGGAGSAKSTINIINGLYVASIDAFQGHEKDFIIFSCVRSNGERKIGFVSDRRRMNVALTRARYGCIVIGDFDVMSNDDLWKEYIEWCEERKYIHSSWEEF